MRQRKQRWRNWIFRVWTLPVTLVVVLLSILGSLDESYDWSGVAEASKRLNIAEEELRRFEEHAGKKKPFK